MQNILEEKIAEIIAPTVGDMGFELVIVRIRGTNFKTLEILIDKLNEEKLAISECQEVSRHISALLDIEDLIDGAYCLEVSSSGIERPLVKFENYIRFVGREVKIKLKELLNGESRYQGKIIKAEDNKVYLRVINTEISIDYNLIKNARLVLTDKMFKELLNQQ